MVASGANTGDGSFPLAELATSVPPDCLVGPEVFTARVPVDRVAEVAATALTTTRGVQPALTPS